MSSCKVSEFSLLVFPTALRLVVVCSFLLDAFLTVLDKRDTPVVLLIQLSLIGVGVCAGGAIGVIAALSFRPRGKVSCMKLRQQLFNSALFGLTFLATAALVLTVVSLGKVPFANGFFMSYAAVLWARRFALEEEGKK